MITNTYSDPPTTKMGTAYSSGSVLRPRVGWIVPALLIFAFSVTPIAWFRYLPLGDYQNHLARLQIHKTLYSNPYLSQFFEFHWQFTPYLGFDLFSLPFMYIFPIEWVGKIVIILTFVMIYSGTILLDRELNPHKWGLSLFSGIFLYNGALKYGFMSYLVGVGVAIWAFWVWVRYRQKADGPWFLIFLLIGVLVCLMHLYAFGIYAVCVAGYECSLLWERFRAERRLRMTLFRVPFIAAMTLVIPVLAFILFSPISEDPGLEIWGNGGAGFWTTVVRKGEALISPIFYCEPVFEIPLVIILAAVLLWALFTNTIAVTRRMVIPLAILAVIFIFMPFGLFGSAYAYYRLPSAVIFIALASFGWRHSSPARIKFISLLLAACLIVRVGSVFADWNPAQAIIGEYDTALRSVPPGSRIMVLVRRTFWGDRKPPLRHVPVLAAALQGVFDPRTFTDGVQLLKLKPNYRGYWQDDTTAPSSISDFKRFDYLMAIRQPPVDTPVGITLQGIERGQTFVLYRIKQQISPSSG
jgi:hypothetical protein